MIEMENISLTFRFSYSSSNNTTHVNITSQNSTGGVTGGHNTPHNNVCNYTDNYKQILFSTFLLFVLFTNLVGNSLVVFACTHSSQLKKRKNTYFIVSLAFCDMLYAIAVLPIIISIRLHGNNFCHSEATCYFIQISDTIANVESMINIFIIAIDRFIAITMPYRYTTLVTATRAKALVAGTWLFSILWSFISLFQWGAFNTKPRGTWSVSVPNTSLRRCEKMNNSYMFAASYIGIFIIPLFITTITYSSVLYVAFTQIKAINTTTVTSRNFSSSPTDAKRLKAKEKRQKEWKATKSIGSVYICYFMCWFPLFVINMISLYKPTAFRTLTRSQRLALIYICVDILPSLNTMLNPLIYSFGNKYFRDGFRMALNRCIGRKLDWHNEGNTFARSTTGTLSLTSISCVEGGAMNSGNKNLDVEKEFVIHKPQPPHMLNNQEHVHQKHVNSAYIPDDGDGENKPSPIKPRSGTIGIDNRCFDEKA